MVTMLGTGGVRSLRELRAVYVLVGADRPVGRLLAQRLGERGARVVLCGDDEPTLLALAEAFDMDTVAVDTARPDDLAAALHEAHRVHGRIDGIASLADCPAPLDATNALGHTRALLDALAAEGGLGPVPVVVAPDPVVPVRPLAQTAHRNLQLELGQLLARTDVRHPLRAASLQAVVPMGKRVDAWRALAAWTLDLLEQPGRWTDRAHAGLDLDGTGTVRLHVALDAVAATLGVSA